MRFPKPLLRIEIGAVPKDLLKPSWCQGRRRGRRSNCWRVKNSVTSLKKTLGFLAIEFFAYFSAHKFTNDVYPSTRILHLFVHLFDGIQHVAVFRSFRRLLVNPFGYWVYLAKTCLQNDWSQRRRSLIRLLQNIPNRSDVSSGRFFYAS